MIKRILLKIWRVLPLWLQVVLSRVIRPLFQVFAAAVILDEHQNILLVKSTYNRIHPWGLPGGSLEYGEHPEEAMMREVWEETHLNVCIEKLRLVNAGLQDRAAMYQLCRLTGGTISLSDATSEFAYFSLENLPDVRPLDRDMIKRLHMLVNHELA